MEIIWLALFISNVNPGNATLSRRSRGLPMTLSFKQAKLIASLLALVVVTRVVANEPPANTADVNPSKRAQVAVSVSKETTYITEPLRTDGSVDYVTALDQQARQRVTLGNNASVLFWQALGPGEIWEEIRDKYFQMLGIPRLPEKGDYFVNIQDYLAHRKDNEKSGNAKPEEESEDNVWYILDPAMKRPWSKQEYPVFAQWLEANEKPPSLIVEASKRPRRYDPLVGGMLIAVPLPLRSCCHGPGNIFQALIARAMLRLKDGKLEEAWDDLLTCHRLARLIGQGPTCVESLLASRTEEMACAGDLAFLQNTHLTAAQAVKMRHDLNRLPPMPKLAEKIEIAERFTYLDNVSAFSRQGLPGLAGLFSIKENKYLKPTLNSLVYYGKGTPVDWDISLCMGNAWFDRIAEAFNKPTLSQQKESLVKIKEELHNLKKKAADANSLERSMLDDPRKAISERLGEVLFVTLGPFP
jgi:hypothetical protein